ncbi:MAG: fructose-6-phosphate aldolase [Deltaproteobacteria bacterium]|nr:fructose-6-phosphate aldolase [Deltaproteobacteria bacterium]
MKIFIDSANLQDIEEALQRGFPRGITTNPSILAKEPKGDFKRHIEKIVGLLRKYKYDIPLSVEVFTNDPEEMVRQGEDFVKSFDYPNINVKIPVGWEGLRAIHALKKRGIKINCTCCMSYNQSIMASLAGADFVSLFYGRIRDIGYDAFSVVQKVRATLKEWNSPTQMIVGSIRHICDINEAAQAGADIITVPPQFFRPMTAHPKTDEAVSQFLSDFKNWLS